MRKASQDIRYLINHDYDLKSASNFVGNHFLLSERQRLAIMRSVCTDVQVMERRKKQNAFCHLKGKDVWIDGFNQIITLEVLCLDSILLEGMDGAIRDLAALRGSYRLIDETNEAVSMMLSVLTKADPSNVVILLDEPVSNSGRLKTRIAEINEEQFKLSMDIQIVRNPDVILSEQENVITSDAVILDHCVSWFNLAAFCVRKQNVRPYRVW